MGDFFRGDVKEYGINFCCNGNIELKETFDKNELEGLAILEKLNGAYDDWVTNGRNIRSTYFPGNSRA